MSLEERSLLLITLSLCDRWARPRPLPRVERLYPCKPCLHVCELHDRQLRRGRVHQGGGDGEIGECKLVLRNPLSLGEVSIEHGGSRLEQRLATPNFDRI